MTKAPETSSSAVRRPVRTATIVWGLLIMAAGILLLAWLLTDISLDPMAVLLGLLIGAGAALLIGGAVAAFGGPHGAGKRNSPQGGSAPGPLTEQAD